MKIVTVLGARPQFIKAATVSRAFAGHHDIEEIIVHTGQHYDDKMSDIFFSELDIPKPKYNLEVGSSSHGVQTGKMMQALDPMMTDIKPDMVLVYGDTNSTLAGALTASKLNIPIAHVEAGLRSFNRNMPEEINRVMTDHISDMLFPPTELAVSNLHKEGLSGNSIHNVGDVMYDAALYYADMSSKYSKILHDVGVSEKNYILATIHRAENTDNEERFKSILESLHLASSIMPVVIPMHPRTKAKIKEYNIEGILANGDIKIIEPVGYLEMVCLEKCSSLILTDSGGVQKEAYFHQVPCLTLRDETEWVELVEHGFNRLVDPMKADIVSLVKESLNSSYDWSTELYGSGDAAIKIAQYMKDNCLKS